MALRIAISFLLVVVCATSALAATIAEPKVTRNGAEITVYNPGIPQQVDVEFFFDEEGGQLALDFGLLHPSRPTRAISLADCEPAGERRRCILRNIPFLPANEVNISYVYSFLGSSISPKTFALSFQRDTVAPTVRELKTEVCRNSTCFVGGATNVTILIDNGPVQAGSIYFRLGTSSYRAANCTATGCTTPVTLRCNDGERLALTVLQSYQGKVSADDAGNPLSAETTTEVYCDSRPPAILELMYNGTGPGGVVTNAGRFNIIARIRELSPTTISANLSAARNRTNDTATAECTGKEEQECLISVTGLVPGENVRIPVTIMDAFGQRTDRIITIPQILEVANATEVPDYFEARTTALLPEEVNRVALHLAQENAIEYVHYISYRLRRTSGSATVVHQSVDPSTCEMQNGTGNWTAVPTLYGPIRVFDPVALWNEQNRLDSVFLRLDPATLPDHSTVRCNLSLVVTEGGKVFQVPEQEQLVWELNLRNSRLGTPGQAFMAKLEAEKRSLEGGVWRTVDIADTVLSTMTHVCQVQGVINSISTTGLGLESIGQIWGLTALSQAGKGITAPLLQYSASMWLDEIPGIPGAAKVKDQTEKIPSAADKIIAGQEKPIRKFCDILYCDAGSRVNENFLGKKLGALTEEDPLGLSLPDLRQASSGSSSIAGDLLADVTADLNAPQLENSLIMSLATQCWSGVVYNLDKFRQVKCGYLECLKEQALSGSSIASCEAAKGTKMCRFVMGEAFELPYARVGKNLMANINKVAQAPAVFVGEKLRARACKDKINSPGPAGYLCRIFQTVTYIEDFQLVTDHSQLFTYPYQADLCSQALCEGEECKRTTNSMIEQLLPGFGYIGDEYRRTKLMERDILAREQENRWALELIEEYLNPQDDIERGLALNQLQALDRLSITLDYRETEIPVLLVLEAEKACASRAVPQAECATAFRDLVVTGKPPETLGDIVDAVSAEALARLPSDKVKGAIENCVRDGTPQTGVLSPACDAALKGLGAADNQDRTFRVCKRGGDAVVCGGTACPTGETELEKCKTAAEVGKSQAVLRKERLKQKASEFAVGISSTALQLLNARGYLDKLRLGGWGDWGASFAAGSADILDPEEWKTSVCNPTGSYGDLTQGQGSVYLFQSGAYRPVLTFAAERLSLPDGELYTASVVAVSPEREYSFTVLLDDEPVTEAPIPLPRRQQLARALSLKSDRVHNQICIMFNEPFPGTSDQTTYCRPIATSAYDRGPVGATLPDIGSDDPWQEPAAYSSEGGNGALIGILGAGIIGGIR